MVDKYTWVDLGSSYLPSDLLAAFLYAQLEAKEHIQEERRRVWKRYHESLAGWRGEQRCETTGDPDSVRAGLSTCSICRCLRRSSETHWLHT